MSAREPRAPFLVALLALAAGAACSRAAAPTDVGAPAETPEALLQRLHESVAALAARPEHDAERVRAQLVLVGVRGASLPGVTRTPAEAEALTAEILARALRGEDFDLLVRTYTDDTPPGLYTLLQQGGDGVNSWNRAQTMAGFGDVAWRLEVGAIGVAPYDPGTDGRPGRSPHGYLVVKRLE